MSVTYRLRKLIPVEDVFTDGRKSGVIHYQVGIGFVYKPIGSKLTSEPFAMLEDLKKSLGGK